MQNFISLHICKLDVQTEGGGRAGSRAQSGERDPLSRVGAEDPSTKPQEQQDRSARR